MGGTNSWRRLYFDAPTGPRSAVPPSPLTSGRLAANSPARLHFDAPSERRSAAAHDYDPHGAAACS
eukprot:8580614-Alexandrium_andersonii.AAC.1